MNIARLPALGTVVFTACTLAACNSSEGAGGGGRLRGSDEIAAARAKLTGKPSGKLTKANAGRIAAGLRRDTASGNAAQSMAPSGSGGSIGTKGLRTLATVRPLSESALDVCADFEADKEIGSCACDAGRVRYEIPNLAAVKKADGAGDVDMRLDFEQCKMNGKVANGLLAIQIGTPKGESGASTKDEDDDESGSLTPAGEAKDMLFVANMTIDEEKIAVAFAIKSGEIWYSQDVDADGKYVLTKLDAYSDGEGSYSVHAENGEFACEVQDGEGECKNEKTGDVIPVEEEAGEAADDTDDAASDEDDTDL